jgi:hypothetical protein
VIETHLWLARLLNRILTEEERRTRLEAHTNVHIQSYVKKMRGVDCDLEELDRRGHRHRSELDSLKRKQSMQEDFNRRVEERMQEMEMMMEAQGERVIALEEEVAILRTKKACKCGEASGSVVGSGSAEDPIELEGEGLEYAEEESTSAGSYHTPPRVEDEPLRIIGSPVSQSLPVDVVETCGCPIPSVIRIEDDVEMVAIPQENEEPLPVRVEELPRYNVGSQRASRGRPLAHFRSSTRNRNRHAKQLGTHPYSHPGYFMGQDLRFSSARELRAAVQRVGRGEDQGSVGHASGSSVGSAGVLDDAVGGSSVGTPAVSPTSTCYRPCSPDCGRQCLGGPSHSG